MAKRRKVLTDIIKKIITWFCTLYTRYKENKAFKKKMEQLKQRDPFIYH